MRWLLLGSLWVLAACDAREPFCEGAVVICVEECGGPEFIQCATCPEGSIPVESCADGGAGADAAAADGGGADGGS